MNEPFPRLGAPVPEQSGVRWGVKAMLICFGIVLVSLFVLYSLIVEPFRAIYGDNAPETLVASSVMNLLWNGAMIASVLWFVRKAGNNARDLGLTMPDDMTVAKVVLFAMITFFLMYLAVIGYGIVIDVFGFDFLEPDQQVPDEFYDSDIALGVLGIAIVISAPITEEIFFRGFLFGGTRPRTGVLLAALITGFIFSMAHYNLGLIIPFTLVGAVLAISYHRTGTLFVPIGAHFLFNLVSYTVLVFVPEARP